MTSSCALRGEQRGEQRLLPTIDISLQQLHHTLVFRVLARCSAWLWVQEVGSSNLPSPTTSVPFGGKKRVVATTSVVDFFEPSITVVVTSRRRTKSPRNGPRLRSQLVDP